MLAHPTRAKAGDQDIAPATAKRVCTPRKKVSSSQGAPERFADWVWQAKQSALYQQKSEAAQEARLGRAARAQHKRAMAPADGIVT